MANRRDPDQTGLLHMSVNVVELRKSSKCQHSFEVLLYEIAIKARRCMTDCDVLIHVGEAEKN